MWVCNKELTRPEKHVNAESRVAPNAHSRCPYMCVRVPVCVCVLCVLYT